MPVPPQERVGSTCASIGGYCFQWFCLNSLQLIFVAAYRGVRHLALVDQLLQQTAQAFEHHLKGVNNGNYFHLPCSYCWALPPSPMQLLFPQPPDPHSTGELKKQEYTKRTLCLGFPDAGGLFPCMLAQYWTIL